MLTDRQHEILVLMAEGHNMTVIGRRLYLTVNTIKTHQRGIYRRLGAVSGAHAVALGFQVGLLHSEPQARPRLSRRELQVVALTAEGLARQAVASQLGISPLTVKSHYERILRRLKASTSAQVVAICYGTGLLP